MFKLIIGGAGVYVRQFEDERRWVTIYLAGALMSTGPNSGRGRPRPQYKCVEGF